MLPLLGGCRHLDGAQVDVLERELRQQEDYIYELEDYLIEYSEKLRQARMARCQHDEANGSKSTPTRPAITQGTLDEDLPVTPRLPLNGRDHSPPAESSTPAIVPPAASPGASITDAAKPDAAPATAPEATPPAAAPTPAPAEKLNPEDMVVPPLEIGPGAQLPWRKSGRLARAPKLPPMSATSPLTIPDPAEYELGEDVPAESVAKTADATMQPVAAEEVAEPESAAPKQNAPRLAAEKLHIRRILRQASDEPGKQPDSLLVVVEALNSTAEPADASGTASLMIMSKDAPKSLRRLDRWDFSAEETKAAWQSSPLGDGLHLELPLEKTELPQGELELWARLVYPDGRKLLTQAPLNPLQLASIEEATEEARLASAEEETATPSGSLDLQKAMADQKGAENQQSRNSKRVAEVEEESAWRPSSMRLDANRVEGFATTADGWSKQPEGEPRLASAVNRASIKKSKPTWQRSTSSRAQGGMRQGWSAER